LLLKTLFENTVGIQKQELFQQYSDPTMYGTAVSFTMLTLEKSKVLAKILDQKVTHFRKCFDYFLISTTAFLAWHLKIKTIILYHKIVFIEYQKIPKT
jgi:hypothetical protein